jgi:DNA-binding NtrC family response regulator
VARILCIDDEPGIQRMVRNALERDGHVVTEALGCTAGRLLVEAGGYDLALVDRRMPDGDGLDLLSLLRARMPGCIRVLMTGFLDLEAVMGAINNAEVHRVIEKPFDSQRLRQELRELLDDATINSLQKMVREEDGLAIKHLDEWMPRSAAAALATVQATPSASLAPAVGS